MSYRSLLQQAAAARQNAYCPYSGFPVGAALLARSGRVYTGCNLENASFGGTICAERAALAASIAAGERQFEALAVVAGDAPTPPCGICRQVLAEFGEMAVVYADAELSCIQQTTLSSLLPQSFSSSFLKGAPPCNH